MTTCNQCGSPMVPDDTALVPALGCVGCGRLIPKTAAKPIPKTRSAQRRELNRVLRAERRMQR